MVEISVGEVSGFIAIGVFLLQFFLPLAVPAILIAFVSDTHTLVTWSVLGRFIQSSPWPTLLNADTVASSGVKRRVNVVAWFLTLAIALVTIASIVTPLGLYETVEPEDSLTETPFQYVKDISAFGYGTPPRPEAYFARNCGSDQVCPGSTVEEKCERLGLLEKCTSDVNATMPETFITPFRDGASKFSSSVSSIFDIQWRTYINKALNRSAGVFLEPAYRQLATLLLDDKIEPLEGLVVDMKAGGLGFRSHTVPANHYKYGTEWKEDILFIEPETQCVNLNFTLDFKIPDVTSAGLEYVEELKLVDHGGFSGLRDNPAPNLKRIISNGQRGFNLRDRAASAAWLNNFLTMVFYNATNPDMDRITRLDVSKGDTFPLPSFSANTTFRVGYEVVRTNMEFGEFLNLTAKAGQNGTAWSDNPFDINMRNFSFITNLCAGSTYNSPSNINTSMVGCTLLYGAAKPTDGGSPLIANPGSRWSLPVYSCASAVKALVKEVTFQYNGTDFSGLMVNSTKPKTYQDDKSKPLWAVEDLGDIPISAGKPLWGILGPSGSTDLESTKLPTNISTTTHEHLYLPGYMDDYTPVLEGNTGISNRVGQNLPGAEFYNQAMITALSISRPYGSNTDYSGQTSLALFAKWQELSKTPEGAAKILNLVWTDASANAVMGTKGWGLTSFSATAGKHKVEHPNDNKNKNNNKHRKRADSDGENDPTAPRVPVTVFKKRIRYKLPFAVPAILILAISLTLLVTLVFLCSAGRTGPKRMRRFLQASSTGRNMGAFISPDDGRARAKTNVWVKSVGMKVVRISEDIVVTEHGGGFGAGAGAGGSVGADVVVKVHGDGDGDGDLGEDNEQTKMVK
ncbi:hypothetical protein FQN53_004680 [Emmonsiellopsis sp. PD_33]|nr:hypothetical protein FQN53_004680 [Emmonsiellopsis sp. PD_33]